MRRFPLLAASIVVVASCSGSGWFDGYDGYRDNPPVVSYHFEETCEERYAYSAERPAAGVINTPNVPSMLGRRLTAGHGRIGLELNPFHAIHGDARAIAGDDAATNVFSRVRFGLAARFGLSRFFELGFHARHTFGADLVTTDADTRLPGLKVKRGTFLVGAGLRFNWHVENTPLTFSLIGEFGGRSRSEMTDHSDHFEEQCATTCYREVDGEVVDSRTVHGEVLPTRTETYRAYVRDVDPDGTIAVQVLARINESFRVFAMANLQPRSVDKTQGIASVSQDPLDWPMNHNWRTYPVVNVGAGVDVSAKRAFLTAVLFYPFEAEEAVDFGPGFSAFVGLQY